MFNRNF